jgi:hypothetical protein
MTLYLQNPTQKDILKNQIDITGCSLPVEIDIRFDGKILWLNVGGICLVRICRTKSLLFSDQVREYMATQK